MAETNSTSPPPPPAPGTGPGPVGVPGGTDRSYQVDIIVCAVITAFIGTVFVALRFYTRRIIIYVLGWEDWLILAAQVFSIAMCICFIEEAILGHGQHIWLIPVENLSSLAKTGWSAILFYELSLLCSQVSIMMLYIRIWTLPWIRRASFALLAIVIAYNIFVIVIVATACVPLRAFWDYALQAEGAYCHVKSIWHANTYLHIIIDFMIYLLPMPVIIGVRFPIKQKVLLFFLFAFGFCICAMSIIRLHIILIAANTADYTFDNIPIAFWSCIETNATVMVACIMTMKPLLAKWFPNLTTPGNSDEQQQQGAVANAVGDRVPTIGSGPSRMILAERQRAWISIGGHEGHEHKNWAEGSTDMHKLGHGTGRSALSDNFVSKETREIITSDS